jgi:hypothetical protein
MNIQKYNDTRIQYHCDTSDIFFLLSGIFNLQHLNLVIKALSFGDKLSK